MKLIHGSNVTPTLNQMERTCNNKTRKGVVKGRQKAVLTLLWMVTAWRSGVGREQSGPVARL